MNVSHLLRELAAQGVELKADGLSLPAPKWPAGCPKHLRDLFAQHRRAIMTRIVPPVFLHIETLAPCEGRLNSKRFVINAAAEIDLCVAMTDDQIIIWLPGLNDERADLIAKRFDPQQAGMESESTHFVTGHKLPSLLRRAADVGRAFCTWNGRSVEVSIWRDLGHKEPLRWIDLREIARRGGWPENFDLLLWNVLHVRPTQRNKPTNGDRPHDGQFNTEAIEYWVTRIRSGLNQLLGVSDLYDRLSQYDEPDLVEVHHAINSCGIGLDVDNARAAWVNCREHAERQFANIYEATEGTMTVADLLNDAYVLSWLQSWGHQFPNLDLATIEGSRNHMRSLGLLHHPSVEAVLQARISLARQPIGSLMRALEMADVNGRVRNHINYFTNRSGEFSSRGIAIGELLAATHWRYAWVGGISTEASPLKYLSSLPDEEWAENDLASIVSNCFVPAEHHMFCILHWRDLEIEALRWLVSDRLQLPGDSEAPWFDLPPPWLFLARSELARQLRDELSRPNQTGACKCRISIAPDGMNVRLPSGRAIHYRKLTSFSDDNQFISVERQAPSQTAESSHREGLNVDALVNDVVRGVSRDIMTIALLRCADAGAQIVAHGSSFIVLEIAEKSHGRTANSLVDALLLKPVWAAGLTYEIECKTCYRLGGGGHCMRSGPDADDGVQF